MTGRTRLIVETFNRLVILRPALCMVYFGYLEFLAGFGNFRMPSMTPLASLYAPIPLSGALIALFTVEQLVNGWLNGFAAAIPNSPSRDTAASIDRHDSRLPRDFAQAGLICSLPLITIGAASAFDWMLAYLRGPIVVSGWIADVAGKDPSGCGSPSPTSPIRPRVPQFSPSK
jgi:hypothetical protein